eukprot:s456_g32.t1
MSDLACWICNCRKGDQQQIEQIVVSSQCVKCNLGASECRCHLSPSEKVQQGIASLNEWLCSEIGEKKLSTTAATLLKARTQEQSRVQKVQPVYEAFFIRFEDSQAIDDLWIPVPREDSRFSLRSGPKGGLEDMGPLPRPTSSASLVDSDPGDLVRVSFRTLEVNQAQAPTMPETARTKRRGVHFEEEKPEKPPERRGDILWHLLPEPAPPPDKKRFGRRRSEDLVSIGSEDSTASSAGRTSQPDQWKRV